ncbi:MAG: hypothetical protein ACYCZD_15875 [Rhodanobacter sp.]
MSFSAGVLGLARECWSTWCEIFGSPLLLIKPDSIFLKELLEKLQPANEEIRDGYALVCLPCDSREAVLRSSEVDAWLRHHDVVTEMRTDKRADVEKLLRTHAKSLEAMLRCRSRESYRSDPPRVFLNRRKIGLASGIGLHLEKVDIYEVGYYHSVLSNEAATRCLVTTDGDREVHFHGGDLYPVISVDGHSTLKSVDESSMADHIGVSTLVVTRDRKLVIWKQGASTQQSRELFAPTGSGSCDWGDLVSASLRQTVESGMEREFLEESFGDKRPVFECHTHIVGYFRWIRRGAKSEFVGATWADIEARALSPQALEVSRSRSERHTYDVPDIAALSAVLDTLCGSVQASVPLWVNALALSEAIQEDRKEWAKILHLD